MALQPPRSEHCSESVVDAIDLESPSAILGAAGPFEGSPDGLCHCGAAHGWIPEELRFLCSPRCNPDLNDIDVKVRGNMRQAGKPRGEQRLMFNGRETCGSMRSSLAFLVLSWPFQSLVFLVILFDFLLTIIFFTVGEDDQHVIYEVGNWLTVLVLSFDVMARLFIRGWAFFRRGIDIFELVLVPVTIIEVFVLAHLSLPVPFLRALRPLLRVSRIIRAVLRTAGKGKGYLDHLRHTISGDRIRFLEGGFDLDLAYITPQIIAMSVPGVGRESILRNPHLEVARFLNERHGNKYLLLNTTEERRYSASHFFDRYYHFPIAQDSVPTLEELMHLCEIIQQFLDSDPENLLAVHSNHGQGRVGVIILALMLHGGKYRSLSSAIAYYEHMRVPPENVGNASTQTLDSASQRRFLEYFALRVSAKARLPKGGQEARQAKLCRVQLLGLPGVSSIDVACYGSQPAKAGRGSFKATNGPLEGDAADAEDQDDDGDMELRPATLMEEVKRFIEECTLDSRLSGSSPLQSVAPIVSSSEELGDASMVSRIQDNQDDLLVPGNWDVSGSLCRGEVRFEVHRRRPPKQSQEKTSRIQEALLAAASRCCGMFRSLLWRQRHEQAKLFDGGMLFCCWLHTDYLELDEPRDNMPSRLRPKNMVMVVLDRFHLDKAANAPSLRSHSAALKLRLEFEVDHRVEWRGLANDDDDKLNLLLSSKLQMTPSSYSLGWLTWVSERVWPSFNSGFEKLMRESLLPSIQESLPGPLRNIRLKHFSLGSAWPKFGDVTACSRHHDGSEVQLDIPLDYTTDTNILLENAVAHFGIEHLSLDGVLSLKFKPLLHELPVFAAMQLLFVNSPEIKMAFNTPGDIANFSMIRNLIYDSINKALCDLMVLPNVININWGDPMDDGTLTFQNVLPSAALRVFVLEAHSLRTGSKLKSLPDVRVQVSLGSQTGRTAIATKTTAPTWEEQSFDFLVHDDRQHIGASVLDVDFAGQGTAIGKVSGLAITTLVATAQDGIWADVADAAGASCGRLHLRGELFDLLADPQKVECHMPAAAPGSNLLKVAESPGPEGGGHAAVEAIDSGGASAWSLRQQEGQGVSPKSVATTTTDLQQVHSPSRSRPPPRSKAVAVLVCAVSGGRLPAEVAAPADLELRVGIGKSQCSTRCSEAQKVDPGSLSRRTQESIERLADRGLEAERIAEILSEDIADVHRIMRKAGWNLEVLQKLAVLVYPADLSSGHIDIALLNRGSRVAGAKVQLRKLLQVFNARYSDVIPCPSLRGQAKADLDMEFRLFSMVSRPLPERRGGERRTVDNL